MIQAPTPTARGRETPPRARARRRSQDPLLGAFERLCKRGPLAPLVVSLARRATVGDVDSQALAARRALAAALALPPGALVAVAAANGPGLLAALIALRRADAAALLLDGQTPAAEALRVARALGARALLRCRGVWPAAMADWDVTLLQGGQDGTGSPWQGAAAVEPLELPGIAVVKLTSGSTGAPRGIATPSDALLADDAALVRAMGLRADDRLVAAIPMAHSYGLSSLALPALARGAPLILPEDGDLCGPFAAAAQLGATVLPTVPAWLDALLRLSQAPARPAALRLVLAAGAPLGGHTAAAFREVFGLPVHVFYGASECGGICYDREGGAAERGTVGTPVDGVTIQLAPVPGGADADGAEDGDGDGRGIVCVRSPAVAAGYVPDPDPPRLGGGRFVAGDLATWRHGELALLGRQDGLVNIKGRKVNPREVEAVLAELAGVDEAVVLGMEVPGRQGEVLRAVIACRPGRLTSDQVLNWCRDRLAAHKVPRSLILVPQIPRTARGKLDRQALCALRPAAAQTAAGQPPATPPSAAPPRDRGRR